MQEQVTKQKSPTGIEKRHSRTCRSHSGGRCNCQPSYRAWVWDQRKKERVRKAFPTLAAAKGWRAHATSQINQGKRIAPSKVTLREAAVAWLQGTKAQPPTILNRNRLPYKPSALRGLEADLNNYVLPDLGAHRLSEITRGDVQALVDRLIGKGLSPSKISNIIDSLRVIYRHEIARERVSVNPTAALELPRGGNPRDRAASATEAAALLAALPKEDRALWATAFYGGLRRGELQALRWDDVDLAAGVIHVRRSWDEVAGEIAPKSRKGTRKVPITSVLRDYLVEHKAATGREGSDFAFGSTRDRPFSPKTPHRRATQAWDSENVKRKEKKIDPLVPIGLHECRHTFVSLMHDAGLSLERIADYVGHSSSYMTDRYRHLLEGHEAEAAKLLDEYLARADTAARLRQLEEETT
jgi:integrase